MDNNQRGNGRGKWGERVKHFHKQLLRTHGQNQGGWNREGGGDVLGGGRGGGKGRQLYLNDNKI